MGQWRRPQWPCAGFHRGSSRWPGSVAVLVLLLAATSLVTLVKGQDAEEKKSGTNTRRNCQTSCAKSPKGRCKKQQGTWTCVGECKKGYARSSSSSALCDACAGGYASAISPTVQPWVASGFPSCTQEPCKGCTQCPLGTYSAGGSIKPLGTPGGAVCGGTGLSNWTQLVTTTPDLSQIPNGPARCLPGADSLLQKFITNSLYAQGANPGSVQVVLTSPCSITKPTSVTFLASYSFSVAYQGDPSIYANIQKAIASTSLDVNTLTGGICSAYYNAQGTQNLCQAFVASTPKGYVITNQGSGSQTTAAVTTTLAASLVMGSSQPCSDGLSRSVAESMRGAYLLANPNLSNETSVAPGGCTQLTINASSYAVVDGVLYMYAWGQVYAGKLSAQALAGLPQGGTLKIKGVNDGGRRLLATDGAVVDPGRDGVVALDGDTANRMARSLLQLQALYAVRVTYSINFIWNPLVTVTLAVSITSQLQDRTNQAVGIQDVPFFLTGYPGASALINAGVLSQTGGVAAVLLAASLDVLLPTPPTITNKLSLLMGIKATSSPSACTSTTVDSLVSSLFTAMNSQAQFGQATVQAQGCQVTGGFAIYTVTFAWTGTLASQDAFTQQSLKPFGPCNVLSSGCLTWSAASGQEILCVNYEASMGSTQPQCPSACSTGLWRGGQQATTCDYVLGGYKSTSATTTEQCPANTYSTSIPLRAATSSDGQTCKNCDGQTSPPGSTSCTGPPPAGTAPAGSYIDSLGAVQTCPSGYTAPFARAASDPTAKFCYPGTNFVGSRYLGSTTKNVIAYQAISSAAGTSGIGCPANTVSSVGSGAAACGTCPDGYTGSGCNDIQPGYYGDTTGGTYGLKLCPGTSSSGATGPSSVVPQPTAASQACTTCAAGFSKTAATAPATCAACPSGFTGLPGGADTTCGYCVMGSGGGSCSPCSSQGNFAAIGVSYAPAGAGCSASTAGCKAGFTGSDCTVPCLATAPVDVFSGKTPSNTAFVDPPDGQTCAIGCPAGTGLSADGSSCAACSGNQYSPGAVSGGGTLFAYPRCIPCPAGMSPAAGNSRCVVGRTPATASGLFDEFD